MMARNTGVIAETRTMEDIYSFYATYENTKATAQDPFYYVNINGDLSLGDAVTVGAFRWIIRVESKFGTPNVSYAREMHFFDGEENTTGVVEAEANSSLFTLHFQSGSRSTVASSTVSRQPRESMSMEVAKQWLSRNL